MADDVNAKKPEPEQEMVSYNNERSGKVEYAPKRQSWFGKTVESVSLPYSARREISRKRGDEPVDR